MLLNRSGLYGALRASRSENDRSERELDRLSDQRLRTDGKGNAKFGGFSGVRFRRADMSLENGDPKINGGNKQCSITDAAAATIFSLS